MVCVDDWIGGCKLNEGPLTDNVMAEYITVLLGTFPLVSSEKAS